MSGNLSAFFAGKAAPVEHVRKVISERYRDDKGKPIEWEIKAISGKEDRKIKSKCYIEVDVPGKKEKRQAFDSNKYMVGLAAACTVFPDLNDPELMASYRARNAVDVLEYLLIPGELAELQTAVSEICGFNDEKDLEDIEEEAKN